MPPDIVYNPKVNSTIHFSGLNMFEPIWLELPCLSCESIQLIAGYTGETLQKSSKDCIRTFVQGEGRWLRDVQRKRFRGWSGGGGSHCHLVAMWVHHLVGRFLWGLKICFFLLLLLIWRRPHPLVNFYHTHSHSVFSFLGTLDNLSDHILCSMVCCISMQLFGHPMLIPSGYD